jgi:hypothetical protein
MRGGHLAILRSGFGSTKESEVAAGDIVPVPGAQFEETLASASPDVLRAMIREFAQRMMDADVEVACNAGCGEVTPGRVNSRNGTGAGSSTPGARGQAIPKLRQGSYFPGFLEHRRPAGRALASVVATSYLLGVSTRRVEKLAASLGVAGLSKSQVSAMAAELDEMVEGFRNQPLDRGPYTFCWIDALTQKVREGGRTVNVHCLIATGVNADGCREILGIDVTSSEDGAGWLAFLRGLAAPGPVRRRAGDQRRPRRPGERHRHGAARGRVAAPPDALPPQPAHPGAEIGPAVGAGPGPDHLRAARPCVGPRPARPGRRGAGSQVPGRGGPSR